jgi:hypothetical protein
MKEFRKVIRNGSLMQTNYASSINVKKALRHGALKIVLSEVCVALKQ